jgi:hypothetical protein
VTEPDEAPLAERLVALEHEGWEALSSGAGGAALP